MPTEQLTSPGSFRRYKLISMASNRSKLEARAQKIGAARAGGACLDASSNFQALEDLQKTSLKGESKSLQSCISWFLEIGLSDEGI